jgi:predicted nuclease with TOPRIM domain
MAGRDISFTLARFEWVTPDRLEVEGSWHGVRRLVRATLVVEVDGKRRRLRALPEDPGTPEQWTAAFPWEGEMPKLPGAELEVGRGIVVDLPRPRRTKARGESAPSAPIPATSRAEREADSADEPRQTRAAAAQAESATLRREVDALRAEVDTLRDEVKTLRTRAEEAETEAEAQRGRAEEAAAEAETLRGEADTLRGEADTLRSRADEAAAEAETLRAGGGAEDADGLRARAEEADALRARAERAEQEAETLRARAEEADALRSRADEADTLRARVEEAEAELAALRARAEEADDYRTRAEEAEAELAPLLARAEEAEAKAAVEPHVARLRAELENVERERSELRAKLDSTAERLESAEEQTRRLRAGSATAEPTEAMPPPATRFGREGGDADTGRFERTRRPAERTAKRQPAEQAKPAIAEKVSDWVGAVIGAKEDEGSKNGETRPRTPAKPAAAASPARSRRAAPAARAAAAKPRRREDPSWALRIIAIGLVALLLLALVLIVASLA